MKFYEYPYTVKVDAGPAEERIWDAYDLLKTVALEEYKDFTVAEAKSNCRFMFKDQSQAAIFKMCA